MGMLQVWCEAGVDLPPEGKMVLAHWLSDNRALGDWEKWAVCSLSDGDWLLSYVGHRDELSPPTHWMNRPEAPVFSAEQEPPEPGRVVLAYWGEDLASCKWGLCFNKDGLWFKHDSFDKPTAPPLYWQERPEPPVLKCSVEDKKAATQRSTCMGM